MPGEHLRDASSPDGYEACQGSLDRIDAAWRHESPDKKEDQPETRQRQEGVDQVGRILEVEGDLFPEVSSKRMYQIREERVEPVPDVQPCVVQLSDL